MRGQGAVGVERERCAIEDQFVLATDGIDIDQRQPGLGNTLAGDFQALGLFVDMKWRYNIILFGVAFIGSWFAFALVS